MVIAFGGSCQAISATSHSRRERPPAHRPAAPCRPDCPGSWRRSRRKPRSIPPAAGRDSAAGPAGGRGPDGLVRICLSAHRQTGKGRGDGDSGGGDSTVFAPTVRGILALEPGAGTAGWRRMSIGRKMWGDRGGEERTRSRRAMRIAYRDRYQERRGAQAWRGIPKGSSQHNKRLLTDSWTNRELTNANTALGSLL